MQYNGKQLFALGCPQNRIKFLVGREFENEEELKKEFFPDKTKREFNEFSIFNFLWDFFEDGKWLPVAAGATAAMSKSELRRLLDSGGVQINECFPKAEDDFDYRIKTIIFFPNSKKSRNTQFEGEIDENWWVIYNSSKFC